MGFLLYTDQLTIIECGACHIPFALPQSMCRDRQRDGKIFYCPNGCKISYHDTENQQLRRKLASANAQTTHLRDQLSASRRETEAERRSKAAIKGHLTRMRNRIKNGVCPWCTRHFKNVQAHVETCHPEHLEKMEEVMSNVSDR